MSEQKDQWLLAEIVQDHNSTAPNKFASLPCEIVIMKQKPYIEFPLAKSIRRRSNQLRAGKKRSYKYSPLVHIRNDAGVAFLDDHVIKPFMTDLLNYEEGQKDELGLLKNAPMVATKTDTRIRKRRRRNRKQESEKNNTVGDDEMAGNAARS
jgi:hypothetical protein